MITAEELLELAACSGVETIDVPELGKVRVRSLTTAEALVFGRIEDFASRAALALWKGLVEPALTEEQARHLVDAGSFGLVEPITQAILRVSGMDKESQKSGGETLPDGGG